jgi:N-acetylmuramic acid 6-phosphate etherase
MSETSRRRAEEFLKIADQFKLGALVTESSHPVTAKLSEVAKRDIAEALGLLFVVDADVVRKYREFAQSGRAWEIKEALLGALKNGGRIFFTGCGATGRLSIQLDSIWRDFWQRHHRRRGNESQTDKNLETPYVVSHVNDIKTDDWESRTFSVMAGGDFALIRSVEGFEDFTEFGKKQIGDLGVSAKDVVFAITEGGETSFVIGTAWKGVEVGAKVYFVYNNPDDVLCKHVERSREVIEDARIEKINLTTGPMAITGSTRMQATSIQLCVMLTVLEMVVRELMSGLGAPASRWHALTNTHPKNAGETPALPGLFLAALEEMQATLKSPDVLSQLAKLVALEESVYRAGRKNNYYADEFGIDVLTDTTERSPTYCTPPFRKFDDATATESWAYLFLPDDETPQAWERILKRKPLCVEWSEDEVRGLVGADKVARTCETVRKISAVELMRFRIGLDGLNHRPLAPGDSAVAIVGEGEKMSLYGPAGFYRTQLEAAKAAGAKTGFIFLGSRQAAREAEAFPSRRNPDCVTVTVPVPQIDFLLDGVTRVAVKMLLNALSTCTMVRLGRVMGNTMIWVVASNLKLIDRATRYVQKLTGLSYEQANHLLFEVIEYVEPRMKADKAYPPVVGLAFMRHRYGLGNEEAERKLVEEIR